MSILYYLGPKGTYSEIAASNIAKSLSNVQLTPISTIAKIVELVNSNENNYAILPIENSIEGIVRPTIDNIYMSEVKIQAQIEINIEHCLVSKGKKSEIKNIISHPQALAQCQKYILNNFDENINLIDASSTSASIELMSNKDETYSAIVSKKLAEELNYNIHDKNISDVKDNKTRFVLVSKKELKLGEKTRTSIVFNTKNESGALLKILSIINKYNLNLIYLESRPSKKVFGEYNFFADIDKGIDELKDALKEIEAQCNYYKFLGSYPSV